MHYPKVSIIILMWNGKDDTIECLESLKGLDYPNYEVIVVDNGSVDGSQKLVKTRFPYIKLIENKKNLEFAAGNNIGIRYSMQNGTDYILLLNNDTVILDKSLLLQLVYTAESDSKIGMAGPKIYFYNEPNRIWFTGGKINFFIGCTTMTGAKEIDTGQYDELREVDCITGCAMLVKRQVIEKIGLLDPAYISYYEDIDWCIRARRNGYKVMYVPLAKVWHKVSASSGGGASFYDSLYRAYRRGRNTILFMRKNAEPIHWLTFPFFAGMYMGRAIFRETLRGNIKAVVALMKGIASNFCFKRNG